MVTNRLSGLIVGLFGSVLLFIIIPDQTEIVDYGMLRPQTLPNACAVLLIGLGFFHALFPSGNVQINWVENARVLMFSTIAAAGIALMHYFGFVVASPILAAALMLAVGERRPTWLIAGIAIVPVFIWLAVVPLLDRTLP